ncbi:hypothetical protein A5742_17900 [Mycolicibacterium fortuitum]|uniref:Lsr2 family protein n=1 Tax=Mycolicibacterium fortuitum TaxID=1766 RepID=A0ABD6QTA9_MYCFO|nr:Lsr2 family protein [Mycolicibacterium fortuitum]OMC52001.1 hypothetical protein A5742_17900 [Mycolicibacterium fortuitum]
MGKIVTVEYIDDLDEVEVDAEVVDIVDFSYRGQEYSLVLTADNGAQFDKDMARYITAAKKSQARDARAARKKSQPSTRKTKPKAAPSRTTKAVPKKPAARKAPTRKAAGAKAEAADPQQAQAIRQWARANGHTVSARGRIAAAVIDAYHAAQ